MDRTLHKISTRYTVHLTQDEYRCLLMRDLERIMSSMDTLKRLLMDTYPVWDISIEGAMIFFSMRERNNDEEEHNLILNDIEMYIEGMETYWTGLDDGEEMK